MAKRLRRIVQLINYGALNDIHGMALGRFPGFETYIDRGWNLLNVLQDRLIPLGVPILGGLELELGHGPDPRSVPLGTPAQLDTTTATLTINPPTQA